MTLPMAVSTVAKIARLYVHLWTGLHVSDENSKNSSGKAAGSPCAYSLGCCTIGQTDGPCYSKMPLRRGHNLAAGTGVRQPT